MDQFPYRDSRPMNTQPKRSHLWLFWLLAVIGLAADQASKYGIFAALYDGEKGLSFSIIPGVFRMTTDYTDRAIPDDGFKSLRGISADHMPRVNHGALFGFLDRDRDGNDGNLLFTLVSLGAALAIVLWVTFTAAGRDRLLCVSLGLILAGTLGNFYDRIVFDGVRDFLHWYYVVDWPVFNIADCCLVIGATLLLFQALFLQPRNAPEASRTSVKESAAAEVVDVR